MRLAAMAPVLGVALFTGWPGFASAQQALRPRPDAATLAKPQLQHGLCLRWDYDPKTNTTVCVQYAKTDAGGCGTSGHCVPSSQRVGPHPEDDLTTLPRSPGTKMLGRDAIITDAQMEQSR